MSWTAGKPRPEARSRVAARGTRNWKGERNDFTDVVDEKRCGLLGLDGRGGPTADGAALVLGADRPGDRQHPLRRRLLHRDGQRSGRTGGGVWDLCPGDRRPGAVWGFHSGLRAPEVVWPVGGRDP